MEDCRINVIEFPDYVMKKCRGYTAKYVGRHLNMILNGECDSIAPASGAYYIWREGYHDDEPKGCDNYHVFVRPGQDDKYFIGTPLVNSRKDSDVVLDIDFSYCNPIPTRNSSVGKFLLGLDFAVRGH